MKQIIIRFLNKFYEVYRLSYKHLGRTVFVGLHIALILLLASATIVSVFVYSGTAHAMTEGGDTVVVDPNTEEPISILENSREPETPNIEVIVPSLDNSEEFAYIQILTVTGGILKTSDVNPITLGEDNNFELVYFGRVSFVFTPAANRNTDASFTYRLVNFNDAIDASSPSTVTIPITPVDVAPTMTTANGFTGTGLTGTYYKTDYNLTGTSAVRLDSSIDFNSTITTPNPTTVWGMSGMNPEDFSVRWTGQFKAPTDGDYKFMTTSDDGVRLWIDGDNQIDNWTTHASTDDESSTLHFAAGSIHDIELDYYERGGGEVIDLQWQLPGENSYEDIPTSALFPGSIRPQLTYLSGGAATYADDGISIHDVDSTTLTSANVAIVNNYHSSEDSLEFTNQNGITGSWDSDSGELSLTGTSSIANYQTALRSVKYYNSNPNPNDETRTIHFMVNDGEEDSNYTTRDIVFSQVNNPPEIIEGESVDVTMDEDGNTTPFNLTLNADDPNFQTVSWTIKTGPGHGTASVDSPGSTVSVHYTPATHYSGDDSFVVQADDGDGGQDTIIVNVTVSPFTDDDNINTSVEDAGPNSGDANNDGTIDSRQSNVSSFLNHVTNSYVSVAIDNTCSLSDVSVANNGLVSTDEAGYKYPLGMVNFSADCGTAGAEATVTQYYFDPPSGDFILRKNIDGNYETVPDATITQTKINGQSVLEVSYKIKDGGNLDEDTLANGTIVDPVGLAQAVTQSDAAEAASNDSNQSSPEVPKTGLAQENRWLDILSILVGFSLISGLLVLRRRKVNVK
jgi:hypothetical protein